MEDRIPFARRVYEILPTVGNLNSYGPLAFSSEFRVPVTVRGDRERESRRTSRACQRRVGSVSSCTRDRHRWQW